VDAEVAAAISQKEVDAEKAKIMEASEKLALRGDATDLSAIYEDYAAQLADARENATHTTSTMDALAEELERIEAFLADEALLAVSTQDDIDAEYTKLNNVYEKLTLRGDPTALTTKQEEYTKELAGKSTEEKYTTYRLDGVEDE